MNQATPGSPPPGDRFFFCRLVPPRPSFALDLTPDELAARLADIGLRDETTPMLKAVVDR